MSDPLDLEPIKKHAAHLSTYHFEGFRLNRLIEEEVPALIAEVERLRAALHGSEAGPQEAREVPEIPAGEKITLDEQYLHHLREAAYYWAIAPRKGAEPRNGRTAAVVLSRNVLCLIDEVRKLRAGSEAGVSARVLEAVDEIPCACWCLNISRQDVREAMRAALGVSPAAPEEELT